MANYTKALTIRCTPEQIETWTKKADEFGISLNHFMRLAANTLMYTDKPILAKFVYGEMSTIKHPAQK